MICLKAPVPYLNRALAEEQLGVDADQQNQYQAAQGQYSGAVQVGLSTHHVNFYRGCWGEEGEGEAFKADGQSLPCESWSEHQTQLLLCLFGAH